MNDNVICNVEVEFDKIDSTKPIEISNELNSACAIEVLKKILEYEQSNCISIPLKLKSLDFEKKVDIFRFMLSNREIKNSTMLLNIINVLKNYNSLSDSFFENESVIFSSILEFLDMKTQCNEDIKTYITDLTKWYLSLFKSLHKVELNYLDDAKKMPESFLNIICQFDFFTMSGIITKSNDFQFNDLILVKDAYAIVNVLAEKQIATSKLVDMFIQHNDNS